MAGAPGGPIVEHNVNCIMAKGGSSVVVAYGPTSTMGDIRKSVAAQLNIADVETVKIVGPGGREVFYDRAAVPEQLRLLSNLHVVIRSTISASTPASAESSATATT